MAHWNTCRTCHETSLSTYTCYGCHEHTPQNVIPKHSEEGIRDLTNCARCHTHKFDPITQEDYYALQAVFAGIGKGDIEFDTSAEVTS